MTEQLLPQQNKEEYIGDGVCISFDGYHIRLRADHECIALDPDVYHAMLRWVARYPALWEHFSTRGSK